MATTKTRKTTLPNVPGAAMVQALGDAVFGKGNAVFGKGNAVVEQTYPVTFTGRPVTVNLSVEEVVRYLTATGWKEQVGSRSYRQFGSLGSTILVPRIAPDSLISVQSCIAALATTDVPSCHPLDVVDAILAARHGAAPPGDPVGDVLAMTLRTLRSAETATLRAELSSRGLGPITTTALHEKLAGIGATRDAHGFWRMPDADAITAAILRLFAVAPDTGIAEDEVVRHLLASGLDVDSDAVGDRLVKMHAADVLKEAWRGKADKRRKLTPHYARGPGFPAATMGDRR